MSVNTIIKGKDLGFLAKTASLNRRLLVDRLASVVFTLGGWTILLSICAILLVILVEVFPLFRPVTLENRPIVSTDSKAISFIVDDYLEIGLSVLPDATLKQFSYTHSKEYDLPGPDQTFKLTSSFANVSNFIFGTESGQILPAKLNFIAQFQDGKRTIVPRVSWSEPIDITAPQPDSTVKNENIMLLAFSDLKDGRLIAAKTAENQIIVFKRTESKALMGPSSFVDKREVLDVGSANVTALALDKRGEYLVVGTNDNQLVMHNLNGDVRAKKSTSIKLNSPISSLAFALGGRTLIVGQKDGSVSTWIHVKDWEDTGTSVPFRQNHSFESHSSEIKFIKTSKRDKVFITADNNGEVKVHYSTTGNTLKNLSVPLVANQQLKELYLSAKSDAIFARINEGTIFSWKLDNPHPEVSWSTLFLPVQYEGYDQPAYVWQSTGGTDDFEPKFSLIPLITGTLKGTFYALLFALPLALMAALYTAQFMPVHIKTYIKPMLEIMAALPSVVIGFIAGLWLAPALEPHLLAIFCMPLTIIGALVISCLLVWKFNNMFGIVFKSGFELFLAVPILALALGVAFPLAEYMEALFFAGDFNNWLYSNHDINVDQRNSIIAGIAVGFAVIPIIFTISEDCLASVPRALSAGSLALGATRWQTALRVVFPIAAPGIFAAVMIGLGRAVGETMIVLMATGNTPLLDFSAFTGFRALSANIAVELPEAPHGGTLYRILFLTALILFAMTFLLNTLSEIVRTKLRKKYGGI